METEKGGGCVFPSCIGDDVVRRMDKGNGVIEVMDCLSDKRVMAALVNPSKGFI